MLALDCAATEYFKKGKYHLAGQGKTLDAGAMVDYLDELCGRYPILSIEDGLSEDDWDGWAALTQHLGGTVQLDGADIFDTHPTHPARGIHKGIAKPLPFTETQRR